MGCYSGVVIYESHLSTTCTAAASDNDVYFLEGGWRGRLITSHISLTGRGVRLLMFALGSSSRSTKVNLTQQQLWQLFGSHLKHSASLLGSAAVEKLAFEMEPDRCSWKPGGSIPWFLCERCGPGQDDFPAGTGILLWWSSGVDLGPDSGNTPGCWPESSVEPLPLWTCRRSWGQWSWPMRKC